jgi:hypothetical protein
VGSKHVFHVPASVAELQFIHREWSSYSDMGKEIDGQGAAQLVHRDRVRHTVNHDCLKAQCFCKPSQLSIHGSNVINWVVHCMAMYFIALRFTPNRHPVLIEAYACDDGVIFIPEIRMFLQP